MASRRHPDYDLHESARKKNDDRAQTRSRWIPSTLGALYNIRKRRILLAVLCIWLLYEFVKHIPTDVLPVAQRVDSRYGRLGVPVFGEDEVAQLNTYTGQPSAQEYDGPIRYFDLAQSLQTFTSGMISQNAVLFAFAHPRSASEVLAAACTMASQKRAVVHVASMGREVVRLDAVLKVSNILASDCPVHWHDAQIDFATQSSTSRLAKGVEGAFSHLYRLLGVQAVFWDNTGREHDYLRSSIVRSAKHYAVAHIPVPTRDAWMLSLDPSSLREWNNLQVDIVIRAHAESSGSLLRLLRSIQKADYGGLPHPRIVLELPPRTDTAVLECLTTFVWPPRSRPSESKLLIRRRIDDRPLRSSVTALQMIESFYPATASSHVLVLSPEAEVTTNFYQLLAYLILEFRHSQKAMFSRDGMMGISLSGLTRATSASDSVRLSQILEGKAELFFGDKWAELQQYSSLRFAADPSLAKIVDTGTSGNGAAWTTLATELLRSQGYSMLQLTARTDGSPVAVVHEDLLPLSEEGFNESDSTPDTIDLKIDGSTLTAETRSTHKAETQLMSKASVMSSLPENAWFTSSEALLIYDADSRPVHRNEIFEQARKYARQLAATVGGCSEHSASMAQPGDLESLFC